jgi:hypothetical protein
MSIYDAYAASKPSWSTTQTVNGSAGNASGLDLFSLAAGLGIANELPILWVVRPTVLTYVKHVEQSAVTSGAPFPQIAKANVQRGIRVLGSQEWPLLMEDPVADSYLAWIAVGASAGTITLMVDNRLVKSADDNPTISIVAIS